MTLDESIQEMRLRVMKPIRLKRMVTEGALDASQIRLPEEVTS